LFSDFALQFVAEKELKSVNEVFHRPLNRLPWVWTPGFSRMYGAKGVGAKGVSQLFQRPAVVFDQVYRFSNLHPWLISPKVQDQCTGSLSPTGSLAEPNPYPLAQPKAMGVSRWLMTFIKWERRMSRAPRIEFEGALYHVVRRGDRQEAIFLDDKDRLKFLGYLEEGADR
jgi:hypothetical protein